MRVRQGKPRITKWLYRLQKYIFDIEQAPRDKSGNVDYLQWLLAVGEENEGTDDSIVVGTQDVFLGAVTSTEGVSVTQRRSSFSSKKELRLRPGSSGVLGIVHFKSGWKSHRRREGS